MNDTKKTIEYVNKTKQDAMRFLTEAQEEVALWTMIVQECDVDIKEIHKEDRLSGKARNGIMICLVIITILILLTICQSCKTMSGIGHDIEWISDRTTEALKK